MKISICLASFSRPERLPLIRKQLENQTFKDFEFLVWDNTIKNNGSQARFWLVKEAKGEAIIFIDDDENLEEDFVEYMWSEYKKHPKHLLGWFTRRFQQESYWHSIPSTYNYYGVEVDYVGTGGCIVSKKIFDDNPELYKIPKAFNKVEDLYLSYVAKREGYKLMAVEPHISIIADDKDQYRDLVNYKQIAFELLREKGFKTYADKQQL